MKQQILAPNTVPTAHLAVNKSRLKVYKNVGTLPTYYLQKGQEFSIELFNPTTDVVLAKISLNGKAISQGGLVLNPGQRVYLDRYLDVAKKFLFDTYEVGKSAEVMAAIKDNGDFKVEFFRENKPTYITPDYGYIDNTYRPNIFFGNGGSGTPRDFLRGSITTGYSGPSTTTLNLNGVIGSSLSNTTNVSSNAVGTSASYTSGVPSLDSFKKELNDGLSFEPKTKTSKLRTRSLGKKSIETGRVEMGSESDQKLKYVDKTFEYYAFHTTTYKMLPVSQ